MTAKRTDSLEKLVAAPLDLLIIGGGIVGSGIARDAALRGLRTGLVEQHDFAFGTSSRSSRLLHGGLRYLAQGRVRLVHEASVEKKVIHHIAPHLADPLPFIFPTYKGNKDWVLWQLKIGVKIYDLLCGGRNLGRSTWLSRREISTMVPTLRTEGLNGAVRYYDGLTNDARLVLDTLRSAEKAGAHVVNYCRYINATFKDGWWTCELKDVLSGETSTVRARAIVNATGPWADGLKHSHVQLRLTKGIHMVVPRSRISVPDTVVMTEGSRILFAIPWGDRTILGTTDTDYTGSIEDVRTDRSDIKYILEITNHFFPTARLGDEDVISAWAGLRPLIADPSGKPSDISRSHEITNPEPMWWDVAGGKLTTYRLMAEQSVDKISAELIKQRLLAKELNDCVTATQPLLTVDETKGISSIVPPPSDRRLVEHFCRNEWAVHLDDVMLRRTSWHYYLLDAAAVSERVADWMQEILGWTPAQRQFELEAYRSATRYGTNPNTSVASASRIESRVATR